MAAKLYRIGTRKSSLALKQVREVLISLEKHYGKMNVEIIAIDTYGDKDKLTPISDIEGTDFFTKELEEALLREEIDFIVHSAKDLPDKLMEGLTIAAITEPLDPSDVLVSRDGLNLDELPYGSRIGTSSNRRKEQVKKYRDDFVVVDIRGNIEERLKLVDGKKLDAIIIAAAGLIRLELKNRITQRIPVDILTPHPLQGALAIEVREVNEELLELFSVIDYRNSMVKAGL